MLELAVSIRVRGLRLGLASKFGQGYLGYETLGYEKVRLRNVRKPKQTTS